MPSAPAITPSSCRAQGDSAGIACRAAAASGITGSAITPFLLGRIVELSDGDSLRANIALVKHNAELGAEIAVAYAAN